MAHEITQPVTPTSISTIELSVTGMWKEVEIPANSAQNTAAFASVDYGWAFGASAAAKWDGQTWEPNPLSEDLHGAIYAARIFSAGDGWAVGQSGAFLHWDGEKWNHVTTVARDNESYYSVDFVSSLDGWSVGTADLSGGQQVGNYGVILRWDGNQWRSYLQSPAFSSLIAVDMLTSNDGWAAGSQVYRWNGDAWLPYSGLNFGSALIQSIAMVSPDDGWMVGDDILNREGVIWHWDGSSWSEHQRLPFGLYSVSMVSHDFGWAVGGNGWDNQGGSVVLNWDGQDWKQYPFASSTPLHTVWAFSKNAAIAIGGGPSFKIVGDYDSTAFLYQGQPNEAPTIEATNPPIPTVASTSSLAATNKSTQPLFLASPVPTSPTLASNAKSDPWLWLVGVIVVLGLLATTIYLVRSRFAK